MWLPEPVTELVFPTVSLLFDSAFREQPRIGLAPDPLDPVCLCQIRHTGHTKVLQQVPPCVVGHGNSLSHTMLHRRHAVVKP